MRQTDADATVGDIAAASSPSKNGGSSTVAAAEPQTTAQTPAVQRQFVNFAFYKLDPAFRRQPADQRRSARDEFVAVVGQRQPGLICLSYSTVGLRGDADLLLWRISHDSDDIQAQTARLNKTALGAYLTTPHSMLSMTKRSSYIDKLDPYHTSESRTQIIPGKRKYLFVYPFVKTRAWYLLPLERRQQIMDEHIRVGNKYPSVKLNTTYSFGLDDQDFVVAFETDEPKDFLDLVMELRETRSSEYTKRDTPIFTCVQMPIEAVLEQLF
jgi:chlorite dismutase